MGVGLYYDCSSLDPSVSNMSSGTPTMLTRFGSLEGRWLMERRHLGAKSLVPEYARPIPSNVLLGEGPIRKGLRYILDPKRLWRERNSSPPSTSDRGRARAR